MTGPVTTELCVTCLVRSGRPRPTVLRAVVCGPCWAAHGGSPDAGEIGPAPVVTAPSCDPVDQGHWLRALRRQGWVQDVRVDGRRNLLKVARLVALWAQWDTLESRPTWARLIARSRLAERTVARWLQELRVRGWLVLLEHGSTPATRPMALAHLAGNRAALYGLRIPLSPEEALARAERQLVTEVEHTLRAAAAGGPVGRPDPGAEQAGPGAVGDETGSLPWSVKAIKESFTGGFTRASPHVDHFGQHVPDQEKPRLTALRAGSDRRSAPDLSIMVPVSGYEMLAAAAWLRERLPVMARCSRRLVRHLAKPYWRAGWCNRDIVHALDHRPGVFGQPTGLLLSPERPVSPAQFIRSRLAAWRAPDGPILPGYWTSRARDASAAREARRRVGDRHGAAGARLLRAGERALSAERIAEHGRAARSGLRTPAPVAPRPGAAAPPPADPRAERDQRRAQLVAQARAELSRSTDRDAASSTAAATAGTGAGAGLEDTGGPADADAYQRALRRARALGHAAAPRRPYRFR